MHLLSVGDRLKYYRKLLNISQKELADNKVSSNLISLIERGRVPLSTVTASILVDNINRISYTKNIKLNLSIKDLMISDEEYIKNICQNRLSGEKNLRDVGRIYSELISLGHKFGKKISQYIIELNIANKLFEIKEYEKASEHYRAYIDQVDIKSQKSISEDLYKYGICLYNTRNNELSKSVLEKLLNIIKDDEDDLKKFDICYLLAGIYYEKKQFGQVVEYLKNGMRYSSDIEVIEERINVISSFIDDRNKTILMNLYKDIKHGSDIDRRQQVINDFDIYEESVKSLEFKNLINKDYFLMFLILLENYISNNELEKARAIIDSARKNIANQ